MIQILEPNAEPVDVSSVPGVIDFAGVTTQKAIHATPDQTVFGYFINSGLLVVNRAYQHWEYQMMAGMYFAATGGVRLVPDEPGFGRVFYVIRSNYRGLFHVGGPIEEKGRLLYIDGCSDSLIIGPPKKGEPCLNHLHFPPGIRQTMHTHPTSRVGVVARGKGECVTPAGRVPLVAGLCWYLPPDDPHCFYTTEQTMDVVAWHPDTDTGPTDDHHPMVRRTIVDGVPAHLIPEIRTKEIV